MQKGFAEGIPFEGVQQYQTVYSILEHRKRFSWRAERSQLYVALDAEYIKTKQMEHLKEQATLISKQCSGLITYLQGYDQNNNKVQEFDEDNFLTRINEYLMKFKIED